MLFLRNHQKGQASTEWLVGTLILLFALFAPLVDGQSVVGLMLDGIRSFYESSSMTMSMP